MQYIDVVVDGRYEEDKRDVLLHWKGSSNQRVIDVPASRKACTPVIIEEKYVKETGGSYQYECNADT